MQSFHFAEEPETGVEVVAVSRTYQEILLANIDCVADHPVHEVQTDGVTTVYPSKSLGRKCRQHFFQRVYHDDFGAILEINVTISPIRLQPGDTREQDQAVRVITPNENTIVHQTITYHGGRFCREAIFYLYVILFLCHNLLILCPRKQASRQVVNDTPHSPKWVSKSMNYQPSINRRNALTGTVNFTFICK